VSPRWRLLVWPNTIPLVQANNDEIEVVNQETGKRITPKSRSRPFSALCHLADFPERWRGWYRYVPSSSLPTTTTTTKTNNKNE
jgi:hypothetical protein